MKPARTLALKRETLRQLTDGELDAIAGGQEQTRQSCLNYISCYLTACLPTYTCTQVTTR